MRISRLSMDWFETKVANYISRNGLAPEPGKDVYVALSGGADSVALLAVMSALGYCCRALHCNFHLRGDESDRDERHARAIAASIGVRIDVMQADVKGYIESHPGTSVEMACREIRYKWFDSVLKDNRGSVLATGHHREDNIETVMLNLLRGTGLRGLTGIPRRRGAFVRPLLDCTRDEIIRYLSSRQLTFVTDSTNLANDYRRNALRNDILPLIYRYFPSAMQGIDTTVDSLLGNRALLESKIDEGLNSYLSPDGSIALDQLKNTEQAPAQLLYEILRSPAIGGKFSMEVVNDILANDHPGKIFSDGSGTVFVSDRGRLVRAYGTDTSESYRINLPNDVTEPVPISVSVMSPEEFNPVRNNMKAYFDKKVLEGNPVFELRRWHEGDRMKPYGMKGSRKLSDIFTDARMSRVDKSMAWVLTRNGKILWVPGVRASRLYTVTGQTTQILCLELKK